MLEVWFTGITLQELFNVLFVVILKMYQEEVSFTMVPALFTEDHVQDAFFFPPQNAIALECVKNGREEQCKHAFCWEI
jgi:hypothetical protein